MADRSVRFAALLVAAAVLIGFAIRVHGLDRRTLTHPEFWVPGLNVPEYVSHPPPRHDVQAVIEQSFYPDVHPPGYHLVMLGWNAAGTDLFWIRLSSVLAGVLAIMGMYLFAREAYGVSAGLLSAALLAVHGYHVFWSQQARPWALLSALALLTAYLMVRLAREWEPRLGACYSVLAGIGLWIDYYFWPIVLGQVVWVAASHRGGARARLLTHQTAAVLIAMPVFIYLRSHLGRPSHLSSDVVGHVVWFLGFGGALHPGQLAEMLPRFSGALLWLAAAGGLALGAVGAASASRRRPSVPSPWSPRVSVVWLAMLAALNVAVVEAVFADLIGRRRLYLAVVGGGFVLALFAPLLIRALETLDGVLDRISGSGALGRLTANPAVVILAVVLGVMAGGTLVATPMFAQYTLLPVVPFFLALTAMGVLRLPRFRYSAAVLVGAVMLLSLYQWRTTRQSNRDYQSLARAMTAQMGRSDIVVLHDRWYSAPLHYYLPPTHFTVIAPPGSNSDADLAAWRSRLTERVWIVGFGEAERSQSEVDSLALILPTGYRQANLIEAYNTAAVLMTTSDTDCD